MLDDSGTGKASMCGAVVTSQRALLVSVTLRTLAAVSLNTCQAPPTSALWLGPALLVCNAAHQVCFRLLVLFCLLPWPASDMSHDVRSRWEAARGSCCCLIKCRYTTHLAACRCCRVH